MPQWIFVVLAIVSLMSCRSRTEPSASVLKAETTAACVRDNVIVPNGIGPACVPSAIIKTAVAGKRYALPVPALIQDAKADEAHDEIVKRNEKKLKEAFPAAAGNYINVVNFESSSSKTFQFDGKVYGGVKLALKSYATPFNLTGAKKITASATMNIVDALTLFLTDVFMVTDGYTWPVFDASGNDTPNRWIPAHIKMQVWHTTRMTRGSVQGRGVMRDWSAQISPNFKDIITGTIGVSDAATLDWGTGKDAGYTIRRVFPAANWLTPKNLEKSDDAGLRGMPVEVREPSSIQGFVNNVIDPFMLSQNLPILASVQCQIKLDGNVMPVFYQDLSLPADSPLTPAMCYDLRDFWQAFRQATYATKNEPTAEDLAAVSDLFHWVDKFQPRAFPDVKPKESWWDKVIALDFQDAPQPATLRIANESLTWPMCKMEGAPFNMCDPGLLPWIDEKEKCRCVPSVGFQTRASLMKEGAPSIVIAESGNLVGEFGERVIPDFTAKQSPDTPSPAVTVLHGCQCNLRLSKMTVYSFGSSKDTSYGTILIPPSDWNEECSALNVMGTVGVSYTLSSVNAQLRKCERVEVPSPVAGGVNDGMTVEFLPPEWVGGRHMKQNWRWLRSKTMQIPARGRVWTEANAKFNGELGSEKGAGKWDDTRPLGLTTLLSAPASWAEAPQAWKDF